VRVIDGFQTCLTDNAVAAEESEAPAAAAIPGLDFSDTKLSEMVDISESLPDAKTAAVIARRKPIYTKPVPRAFERAWAEGREMVPGSGHASRLHENSVGLLGESPGDLLVYSVSFYIHYTRQPLLASTLGIETGFCRIKVLLPTYTC